jgi:Mechanosensitive ion channel
VNKLYRLLSHKLSWLVIAIIAGLFMLCPVIGVTAEQKSPEHQTNTTPVSAPAAAPSGPLAIPLADVAIRTTEVENLLQNINKQSEPIPDIENIREMLPEVKAEINRNLTDTMIIINQQPMLSVLQTQQQQWQEMRMKTTGWLSVLTKRSNALQNTLDSLSDLQKTWEMTLNASQTAKVTNWTLSDQLRRIDLPVGVNYSAPPGEVIKILVAVALANPNILKDPEPQCLFMGFGDSSINFELRAWTDQFDDWPSVRSELASAIYDAVYAAGMTFPFPQREVRLLRDQDGESGNQR